MVAISLGASSRRRVGCPPNRWEEPWVKAAGVGWLVEILGRQQHFVKALFGGEPRACGWGRRRQEWPRAAWRAWFFRTLQSVHLDARSAQFFFVVPPRGAGQ